MAKVTEYLSALLMIIILTYTLPRFITKLKESYYSLVEAKIKVGVLHLKNSFDTATCFTYTLKRFFLDPDIKGIVLLVDCPPLSFASAQAFFKELIDLKKQYPKITVALLENACVGSAYYCALGADYIIAQPASIIGGLTLEHKDSALPSVSSEDTQRVIQQIHKQFTRDILSYRPKLSRDESLWTQKIFTGEEAQKLGLIDDLGYTRTVENILHTKAPIEGEITWVNPQHDTLFSQFFASESECTRSCKPHSSFIPEFLSMLTGGQ